MARGRTVDMATQLHKARQPQASSRRATAVLLTLIGTFALGDELPSSSPEEEGLSSERLVRIKDLSQRHVDSGAFPGALTLVARDGKIVHVEAVGTRGARDSRPLTTDSLFRMYSSGKPVTAVALMQLYEQGKFRLQDPVSKFLPELAHPTLLKDGQRVPARNQMTMRQLVSHTSGLSYGLDVNNPVDRAYNESKLWQSKNLDELAAKIGGLPLLFEPGDRFNYSVGMDLAGLVVQRLSCEPFDKYLQAHLFGPLDMHDTGFSVPREKLDRLLPNHFIDAKTGRAMPITRTELPDMPGGIFEYGCNALCDYQDVTLFFRRRGPCVHSEGLLTLW